MIFYQVLTHETTFLLSLPLLLQELVEISLVEVFGHFLVNLLPAECCSEVAPVAKKRLISLPTAGLVLITPMHQLAGGERRLSAG